MTRSLLLFAVLLCNPVFSRDEFRAKVLSPASGAVGRYETIEIGVQSFLTDRLFRNFSNGQTPSLNPYNAANFSLHAQFSCHGKTYNADAFYCEDAHADDSANVYKTSASAWPWRIRFAPPDTGTWQMLLLTGDPPKQIPHGTGVLFRCELSTQKGWLKVSGDEQRLCFQNNDPFFAIGQNIAWADGPVLKGQPGGFPAAGFFDIFHCMNNLADNGGNYVRIVMAPWSTGIEWEEAGVYHQGRAAAMDSMLSIAEKRGLYIHLCIEMHTGYEANYSPPHNWENNPYHKALNLQFPYEVLTNDSAIKLFEQKMRYIEARWGYSPHVAVIEILSEMNGWDDYSSHTKDFISWHKTIVDYCRNAIGDTLHIFTSCFGVPPFGTFFDAGEMQVTSYHYYTNNFYNNRHRFAIINGKNAVRERRGMRVRWNKPCIFGEMGLITDGADPGDLDKCNDVTFHDDLWATAFMGCFGAGLNWWDWNNDAYRKANFPALRFFVDSVCNGMQALNDPKFSSANGIEVFYSGNAKGNFVAGWMHNTSYWWGNVSDSCIDRNGKKMNLPADDDKFSTPQDRSGKTVSLSGFRKKTRYAVSFYDTGIPGKILFTNDNVMSDRKGRIKIAFPKGVQDCAFRVRTQSWTIVDYSW